jgi:hypothetical protein
MSLGSGFPEEFRVAQIRRRLRPGAVIKLFRKMDDGRLHEKRFVVLHVDDHTITCVINSEISQFIRTRPALLRCQVRVRATEHDFMDHDSHIDCSRVRSFLTEEVIADLMSRPEWILGQVGDSCCNDIAGGIKASETLSVAEVEKICSSLASRPSN